LDISLPNVHVIVRDNGANMVKAMAEANSSNFGCFAHTLQLVVDDGLLSQHVVICYLLAGPKSDILNILAWRFLN